MQTEILIPKSNEKELLERAKAFGYEQVVFLYEFKNKEEILKKKKEFPSAKIGTLLLPKKPADFKRIHQLARNSDLVAVSSQDENLTRLAVSNPLVDLVFSVSSSSGREHMEYRRSGFDVVCANIAKENKVFYGLNFSALLSESGAKRAKLLGREIQNIFFSRRKTGIIIASFGSSSEQIRNPFDLASLGIACGLNGKQAKESVGKNISEKIKMHEFRRTKEYVREGVRIVN